MLLTQGAQGSVPAGAGEDKYSGISLARGCSLQLLALHGYC